MIYTIILIVVHAKLHTAVTIGDHLHAELTEIIKDYCSHQTDKRFQDKISFGEGNIHSLIIWSPLEQYSCKVYCALHRETELTFLRLTSTFGTENRNTNPR